MKRCASLLVVFLLAGFLATNAWADGKNHKITAEVVSVDAEAKMLTIKTDAGEQKTVPVQGNAVSSLKDLKAGDKVELTCSDNEKGEHQAVTAVVKAKSMK